MWNNSDQYIISLKQCLLSLYYKRVTVCLEVLVEFHETHWILKQFHPILSAKFSICIGQLNVLCLKGAWNPITIFVEVITSQWFWKLLLEMMNPLLNNGNSTELTRCPSALCVSCGCLKSWLCLRIKWVRLHILWLRLQTKLFQIPTFLKTNSLEYHGLTMLVNKLLKNLRKLYENFSETLLQKMYLPLNNWEPKPDI